MELYDLGVKKWVEKISRTKKTYNLQTGRKFKLE
jgi:hypothetical protein